MKKIILSGSNGNIGKSLLYFFLKKNFDILIISSNYNESIKFRNKIGGKYKILSYDHLRKYNSIEFNYCPILFLDQSKKNFFYYFFFKIKNSKTKKILNFAKKIKCKNFIYFSSLSVFDTSNDLTIKEQTVEKPLSKYGICKFKTEIFIKNYCDNNHLKYTILRLPSVYNSKFKGKYKFIYFLSFLRIPIPMFRKNVKKSFLNLNLLKKKILKVIKYKKKKSETLYIADKNNYTIEKFLNNIFYKNKIQFIYLPHKILNILNILKFKFFVFNHLIIKKKL